MAGTIDPTGGTYLQSRTGVEGLAIRFAGADDVALVLELIRELAQFERLSQEVVATEALLRETLFGTRPVAEIILGFSHGEPAAFALFFHNYSTFLGRPGVYLEDLFVRPQFRRKGIGHALFVCLAQIARQRGCGRLEWSVLDWNESAIHFYESLGAEALHEWTTYRVTGAALDRLAGQS